MRFKEKYKKYQPLTINLLLQKALSQNARKNETRSGESMTIPQTLHTVLTFILFLLCGSHGSLSQPSDSQ